MTPRRTDGACEARGPWRSGLPGWGCLFLLLLAAGCTSAHYRRSADTEVYRIIREVDDRVFGRTNAFTIDTAYSSREPAEILPAELIEDRQRTNRQALTLDQALAKAVEGSRRYQAEKERLYLTALSLTGERYEFGPQFFAGSTASFSGISDGERSGSVNTRLGVSQLLKSGGRLGLSLANDLFRYYSGDPQRSAVSTISVNLVQPLLRGFGRNNPAVESLTQAERNVVYAVRDYSFFQQEFALEIVRDYFDLLAQKDIIRNRYTNYLIRVQATERLEARKDREQQSQVGQARQSELTSKNDYVNAVALYRNSLDQFKIKLGLPLGETLLLDDTALREVGEGGLIPVPLTAEDAFRVAVQRQLPVLNAIDQFEDSKRKVRVAADRLRADLELFADASIQSDGPTDYTEFDPDQLRYGVGLQLDLPLDRLRERNAYRATLVAFESELRDLTLTLDNLRDAIERGLRTLEQRRQNYEIQRSALALADLRVESETLLVQAGRTEVRNLLEAQDAQVEAQNAVTAALVSYQESRLELMLNVGLLDTSGERFWLRDHVAPFAAEFRAARAALELPRDRLIPPDEFFEN